MSYINFKGTVKKINLKSAEETEITISIPASELDGQYNTLQSMLELKVIGGLDSQIVTYKVLKNARTGKPLTKYTVNNGVVSVVPPEGEQLSMDLGLPPEKVEIKADPEQIDLEIIHGFILTGLAPRFDDMDYDFHEITERLVNGDTYLKIAADIGMGVGVFVVMVDEYRKRVAPSAAAWHEWMQSQGVAPSAAVEPAPVTEVGGSTEGEAGDIVIEEADGPVQDGDGNGDGFTPEWEGEGGQPAGDSTGSEEQSSSGQNASEDVDKEQLDAFILAERPIFPEVEYEGQPIPFPNLLEKRLKEDKTWREIANENGMTSGQLSTRWTAYRKLAAMKMKGDGGAA